jgi:DNA-binding transcriptional regulator GbsR (MarR family)
MSQSDVDTDAAREEVIEAMARGLAVYGANRSYGRLYGILFFAEEPLSLDELAEEGGYAKSTVSTAMSALERLHFVHRRSMPDEGKKAYFEAETDLWYAAQEILNQEVMREIRVMSRALDSAAETFEKADSAKAQRDLEKVRRLHRLYVRGEKVVSLLTGQSMDRLISVLERLRATDNN